MTGSFSAVVSCAAGHGWGARGQAGQLKFQLRQAWFRRLRGLWDINPEDYNLPGVDEIVSHVVDNVGNGDIILLHDGSPGDNEDRSQTVAAVPTIIDTLRSLGYSFGALVTTSGATRTPTGPTGPNVPIGRE